MLQKYELPWKSMLLNQIFRKLCKLHISAKYIVGCFRNSDYKTVLMKSFLFHAYSPTLEQSRNFLLTEVCPNALLRLYHLLWHQIHPDIIILGHRRLCPFRWCSMNGNSSKVIGSESYLFHWIRLLKTFRMIKISSKSN